VNLYTKIPDKNFAHDFIRIIKENRIWIFRNTKTYFTSHQKKRTLKLLDHYEIYKKILRIKGEIVEFGVFKGTSLIRFLTFRDLLEKKINEKW
jgi:hypothetical protein